MQEKIISRPDQSGTNSCAAIIVAAGSGVRAPAPANSLRAKIAPLGHDNFRE